MICKNSQLFLLFEPFCHKIAFTNYKGVINGCLFFNSPHTRLILCKIVDTHLRK